MEAIMILSMVTHCGNCPFLYFEEWAGNSSCVLEPIDEDELRKSIDTGTFPELCPLEDTMRIVVPITKEFNILKLFDSKYEIL